MNTNNKSVEEQLKEAQAEIARLQELQREEARRKARYPWENPEVVQNQTKMGYNFKMEPELYLKIQWLMEHKGGIKSIQVFLDRAANRLADDYLEELGAN